MTIPFPSVQFLAGNSDGATKRTMTQRTAEIFNVLDYGADPTGANESSTNIRAALAAMWANGHTGSTLFFPPGSYKVSSQIDISFGPTGGNNSSGRIIGAATGSVFVGGNVSNGFIFFQPDDTNGPGEIAHMTIGNSSTWIGSGALCINNSKMVVHHCTFNGMINILGPSNIFTATIDHCTLEANTDSTTGTNGTLGIAGACINVKQVRSSGVFQACIQLNGGNSCVLEANSIERAATAILLGPATGWASSVTVAPDGANPGKSIMTVSAGGFLGSTAATKQFFWGSLIYGRGLPLQTWGTDPNDPSGTRIVDTHGTDPALTGDGFAGTYRIDKTATITTPVPVWSRSSDLISSVVINSHQSEACHHTIYVDQVSAMVINGGGCGSTPNECLDAFGNIGYTPRCAIYVNRAASSRISGFSASLQTTYLGQIVIDPNATISNLTFDSCVSQKKDDNVTTGTISNGSGGAGTIMNITAVASGSFIGVGMPVTGTGVSANTIVTASGNTDVTLTGGGATGTYRVNNSQNLSSRTLTIPTGTDWIMPTASSSKAGLKFINCGSGNPPAGFVSGLNNLAMTFNSLPGQAGASTNVALVEGQTFDIVDCNTSTFLATAAGGGTGATAHRKVRYNGAAGVWQVIG